MKQDDTTDPKRLIAEAYRIEGIGPEECRSIFLDWALSVEGADDVQSLIRALLVRHGDEGHPMTTILREGLVAMEHPRRRGGWRSRTRP